MANCLNCGKEIKIVEGRRPRLYCDNKGKCKGEHFRKQKKEPKYVQKSVYDKLQEKYQNVISKIDPNAGDMTKLNSAIEFKKPNKKSFDGKRVNYIHQDEYAVTGISDLPPRLEGESLIDYKIRMSELNEKK